MFSILRNIFRVTEFGLDRYWNDWENEICQFYRKVFLNFDQSELQMVEEGWVLHLVSKTCSLIEYKTVIFGFFYLGEAVYCDDMPHFENELYLSLVLSTQAHAEIVSIDASQALAMEGVHAFFSARDLPEPQFRNCHGILHDDQVFAAGKVS